MSQEKQNYILSTNMAVVQVLQNAKEDIETLYGSDDAFQAHKLRLGTQLERMLRSLGNLEGLNLGINTERVSFPPITEFMGEKIEFTHAYVNADIANPNLDEMEQFKKKVNDLYTSFPGISLDTVMREYKGNANMELLLRGVASLANVPNYAEAAINEQFYEAIAEGIKRNEAEDTLKKAQELSFLEQTKEQPKAQDIELSAAYLNAFPELLTMGYQEGDKVPRSVLDALATRPKTPPAVATPPVSNAVEHEDEQPSTAFNEGQPIATGEVDTDEPINVTYPEPTSKKKNK